MPPAPPPSSGSLLAAAQAPSGGVLPAQTLRRMLRRRGIPPEVAAAYDAPFPSEWHKAGVRQFPALIPVTRSDPGAALNLQTWQVLRRFERPFLTLFGDGDPPTRGWDAIFRERVPGAAGQPHATLENAGHFWQEDCGAEAAAMIVDWIAATR